MNVINHIKELAFERQLKNDCAKLRRERRQFNADEVISVGVLYHFSDEGTDVLINKFVSELRGNKRNVKVIGLFKGSALPPYYTPKNDWDILLPKGVNWFNKPVAPFVKAFCDQKFDLLIDLTMEDLQPIVYAGALSRAHFKTGRYTERNAGYYDLMIHTEQVQTLPEFIQHVKYYISKVNR